MIIFYHKETAIAIPCLFQVFPKRCSYYLLFRPSDSERRNLNDIELYTKRFLHAFAVLT